MFLTQNNEYNVNGIGRYGFNLQTTITAAENLFDVTYVRAH